jgi:hypothetical protein
MNRLMASLHTLADPSTLEEENHVQAALSELGSNNDEIE